MSMSKGDETRPYNKTIYDSNYDNIKWSFPKLSETQMEELMKEVKGTFKNKKKK